MPLIPSRSKKAISKNIETEMEHGKPQNQAIAIAYHVKRKPKKKMAKGGDVAEDKINYESRPDNGYGAVLMRAEGGAISAKDEKRPMPDDMHNDSLQGNQNRGRKSLPNDQWTDNPTVAQAQSKPKVQPIRHPKMVPSNAFSTRLYDKESHLMDSESPGPYDAQPESDMNEMGADRQGPKVRDMQDEHSTHRKPYAKGGQIEADDSESHNIHMRTEMEPEDHAIEEMEREDESSLQAHADPSHDEGEGMAHSLDEEGQDRQGPKVPDMEREHSNGRMPYAEGGLAHEMDDIDVDEMENEHYSSIAAAIMAKKDREKAMADSGSMDMNKAVRMADGGILSAGATDSDDSDQADLERNAEEDQNHEDQLSFGALRKENYSESEGLKQMSSPEDSNEHGDHMLERSEGDKHDMVSSIRRKMISRRQFKRP